MANLTSQIAYLVMLGLRVLNGEAINCPAEPPAKAQVEAPGSAENADNLCYADGAVTEDEFGLPACGYFPETTEPEEPVIDDSTSIESEYADAENAAAEPTPADEMDDEPMCGGYDPDEDEVGEPPVPVSEDDPEFIGPRLPDESETPASNESSLSSLLETIQNWLADLFAQIESLLASTAEPAQCVAPAPVDDLPDGSF